MKFRHAWADVVEVSMCLAHKGELGSTVIFQPRSTQASQSALIDKGDPFVRFYHFTLLNLLF